MIRGAYYNEHDKFAAAWLRELIKANLIAPGEVDERSIEDVKPNDLDGYAQCHFFAGIGVWSLALREAGWGDDRAIWTGSCPCQPFSAAGKGGGFDDERHLWPAFHHLISECRPDRVVGEQVASKDGLAWLDLVYADMEGAGYAFGAVDTCAAGFGAPHIRQRLYWAGVVLADASGTRLEGGQWLTEVSCGESAAIARETPERGRFHTTGGLGNASGDDMGRLGGSAPREEAQSDSGGQEYGTGHILPGSTGPTRWLADADCQDRSGRRIQRPGESLSESVGAARERFAGLCETRIAAPTNGLWRNVDWLGCRDGKWRPVEPGTFPLADAGTFRNRVGELCGAGNAINLAQAQGFIEAMMQCIP